MDLSPRHAKTIKLQRRAALVGTGPDGGLQILDRPEEVVNIHKKVTTNARATKERHNWILGPAAYPVKRNANVAPVGNDQREQFVAGDFDSELHEDDARDEYWWNEESHQMAEELQSGDIAHPPQHGGIQGMCHDLGEQPLNNLDQEVCVAHDERVNFFRAPLPSPGEVSGVRFSMPTSSDGS
jgi:hypothetical protein